MNKRGRADESLWWYFRHFIQHCKPNEKLSRIKQMVLLSPALDYNFRQVVCYDGFLFVAFAINHLVFITIKFNN